MNFSESFLTTVCGFNSVVVDLKECFCIPKNTWFIVDE